MCVKARKPLFIDAYIVTQFVRILENAARRWSCWVIYCFMPDHLHLVIHGSNPDANLWRMLVEFKQKTGFWLSKYHACGAWQKDFHDHVIRKNDDLSAHVRYVLENPCRKGLVEHWENYPMKGSIGCDLGDVLTNLPL